MILAIEITPTGQFDTNAPLDASHQPKPVRIEAAFFGIDMQKIGSLDAIIRPDNWKVPANCGVSQLTAEKFGVNPKNPLALITGKGGWIDGAGFVLCHDFTRLDFLMRIWRVMLGGNPDWLRPRIQKLDTAVACQSILKLADSSSLFPDLHKLPTLTEATAGICGGAIDGLDGVMDLYQELNSQGAIEEIAA